MHRGFNRYSSEFWSISFLSPFRISPRFAVIGRSACDRASWYCRHAGTRSIRSDLELAWHSGALRYRCAVLVFFISRLSMAFHRPFGLGRSTLVWHLSGASSDGHAEPRALEYDTRWGNQRWKLGPRGRVATHVGCSYFCFRRDPLSMAGEAPDKIRSTSIACQIVRGRPSFRPHPENCFSQEHRIGMIDAVL